jgi:hypothetical protein
MSPPFITLRILQAAANAGGSTIRLVIKLTSTSAALISTSQTFMSLSVDP